MNREKNRGFLLIIIPVIMGCFIYGATLHYPFQYDDNLVIEANSKIKKLEDPGSIVVSNPQRAVLLYTFAINYKLGKLDTFGYHAVNVGLHLLNGILLFIIVQNLVGPPSGRIAAFLASALFMSHPVNVESVTYISSRSVLLCGFFFLAAILYYIKAEYAEKTGRFFLFSALSFFSFILSCFSKETGVTLPFILLALRYSRPSIPEDAKKRVLALHVFYWTGAVLILFLRFYFFGTAGNPLFTRPATTQFYTQVSSFIYGLKLLMFPFNLTVDHYFPLSESFVDWRFILSIMLAGTIACLAYLMRGIRFFVFSLFWILFTQLPTLIVPLQDIFAERWLYFPSMGFSLLFSSALIYILKQRMDSFKKTALILILSVPFLNFFVARNANSTWESQAALWENAIKRSPSGHPSVKGLFGMGSFYQVRGMYDKAIEYYSEVLRHEPGYTDVYINLAECNMMIGNETKAHSAVDYVLSYEGENPRALYTKGFICQIGGDTDNAEKFYKKTLSVKPDFINARDNLGAIYITLGRLEEAMEEIGYVLEHDPDNFEALNNMGTIYKKRGMSEEAIGKFTEALKANPNYIPSYINLGIVYIDTGKIELAREMLKKALIVDPKNMKANTLLNEVEARIRGGNKIETVN